MNPINQCAECMGKKEFLATIASAEAAGAIIGRIVASVLNPTEKNLLQRKSTIQGKMIRIL
ncbi:MAG: hypothetical protein JSS09_06185 [Verrucomicrobia bacterium]|nr:hypothetical protein [Verrucomicrobiota bacterium]